jgi:hypothetical protein
LFLKITPPPINDPSDILQGITLTKGIFPQIPAIEDGNGIAEVLVVIIVIGNKGIVLSKFVCKRAPSLAEDIDIMSLLLSPAASYAPLKPHNLPDGR